MTTIETDPGLSPQERPFSNAFFVPLGHPEYREAIRTFGEVTMIDTIGYIEVKTAQVASLLCSSGEVPKKKDLGFALD